MIRMNTLSAVYFFTILLLQRKVVGFSCNSDNCRDCASNTDAFGITCRWCRRDNECHTPGAIFTNPCKRAENIVDPSLCEEELSHYDPELSLKMLLLSAVAYDPVDPQECLDNSLPSAGFQIKHIVNEKCDFSDHKCSGYVAVSHTIKAIAVAFRGSECFDQAFSAFVESLVRPKEDFLSEGEVQSYWKRAFEKLWPSMEAKVKALIADNLSYPVWVTGHSLGGAMASLASAWLSYYKVASRKNIILYTFGMPRVGNYDYALEHDRLVSNSWRVVNYDDPVPHFPSLLSVSIVNGPYHHGVEAFYSKPATSVYSEHRECHGKPYNEDTTCSFSEMPPYSFKRHKNYFSIPVGTFWEKGCVHSTRKKREAPVKHNNTRSNAVQSVKDRCLKYTYKNGSYVLATGSSHSRSERSIETRSSTTSMYKRSFFCFMLFFTISTGLE